MKHYKVYSPAFYKEIIVDSIHDYFYYKVFNGFNYDQAAAYATQQCENENNEYLLNELIN